VHHPASGMFNNKETLLTCGKLISDYLHNTKRKQAHMSKPAEQIAGYRRLKDPRK